MNHETIEREVFVQASPEIVFDVVSSPDQLKNWWPDDAQYDPTPGSAGRLVFGDPDAGGGETGFCVVDARPPRLFSFRWTQPVGEAATPGNSLLVTFELIPSDHGTLLKMTETGFHEAYSDAATLERQYNEHSTGWDHFLPRLAPYVASLQVRQ